MLFRSAKCATGNTAAGVFPHGGGLHQSIGSLARSALLSDRMCGADSGARVALLLANFILVSCGAAMVAARFMGNAEPAKVSRSIGCKMMGRRKWETGSGEGIGGEIGGRNGEE